MNAHGWTEMREKKVFRWPHKPLRTSNVLGLCFRESAEVNVDCNAAPDVTNLS